MKRMLMAAALAAVSASGVPATAAPPAAGGTVVLDVNVPEGGRALVELRDANGRNVVRSVVVEADGALAVSAPAGTYRIVPRQVMLEGERFVGRSQGLVARVRAGATTTVDVDYVRSRGVQGLTVTELGQTSATVDWEIERGAGTTVWRLDGDDAPTRPGQGTEVPLADGSSFTDNGLEPGGVYTYAIFARPGDGSFGRDDVDPVTITVGTEDNGSTTPLFVLSPGAQILDPEDFTPYSGGDSLVLKLANHVPTPTPGTILSVPVSAALPGGYLGEVVSISADGRTIELVQAPMASAFDLYHLDVPDIAALPDAAYPPGAPAPALAAVQPASVSAASSPVMELAAFSAASKPLTECTNKGSFKATPKVSQSHGGHAKITIDKFKMKYFEHVPETVHYDVGYTTTVKATVDVEASGTAACGLNLPMYHKPVVLTPVPIYLYAEPTVEVSVFGKGTVENLGGAVTAGFQTTGKLSLVDAPQVGGELIVTGTATEPKSTDEIGLNLLVDGSVLFGPGAGSEKVGVIFGVGGTITPLDATASIVTVEKGGNKETCVKVDAKRKAGMFASLKAWVPGYEKDYSIAIPPQGEQDWGGSPFFWPNDCTESGTPTNDVVGDGLTVISDDLTGDDDQFGKVDGFVPGEGTWVLSTGRINDVVGAPSSLASTALGGAGSTTLSQLSAYRTYDAASYKVTVVPNGRTLVVGYAFASEEYPEWVGSRFNDVMGVFVNGVNCALVPGTSTPVSINTINDKKNSKYYVNNLYGAAGYGTTMDGLTVPLECRVPVKPGEKVTVEIAVADASDGVLDSAVALLDGGIYSE